MGDISNPARTLEFRSAWPRFVNGSTHDSAELVETPPAGPGYRETMQLNRPRIAMYSHDTVGLGHLRRNLMIARTLSEPPVHANVLLIAGTAEAKLFPRPPGVDIITLPALCKESGKYQSRTLDIPLEQLTAIRARTICAAIEGFDADLFIVDKVPRGALGELEPTLEFIRGKQTVACVLGLRDILDEPEAVRKEWRDAKNAESVARDYDAVWVYGDRSVYDLVREYHFGPELAEKIRYTGYLDSRVGTTSALRREGARPAHSIALPPRFVLCTVGGGQDGAKLAETFAQIDFPEPLEGVILLGPFMREQTAMELRRRAAANPKLHVVDFVSDPSEILQRAERVICMGGYNTICEIIAHEKPALVVPRVDPRHEQQIRAERLAAMGMLEMCPGDEASPERIQTWLEQSVKRPRRSRIDLCGLLRLPELVGDAVAMAQANGKLVRGGLMSCASPIS